MKKILVIATMAATLSGLSAFGQGSFVFGSSAGWVWDNYGPVGSVSPVRNAGQKVSFLIGTGLGGIQGVKNNVETNASTLGANQSWALSNTDAAWAALLGDANNPFAVNNGTSGPAGLVIGTTTATGGIAYNGGAGFFIDGTSSSGGSIQVRIVAWDGQYATPAAAAAAHSAVGWGAAFTYNYGGTTGTPGNFSTQAGSGNGAARVGVYAPVPEPGTFALAGLGIASMLIARRRK